MKSEIQDLKAAGKYREAAQRLLAGGNAVAAAELLAEVWDFEGALEIARSVGAYAEAYRYAVEAEDEQACEEFRRTLEDTNDDHTLRQLADFAVRRGRDDDAAYFFLWADDAIRAAQHFAAADRPLLAARLLVSRGRARDAVELLARSFKREPVPEVALGLAQALCVLGRHQKALDILQPVRMPDELFPKQQKLVAACLRQLGVDGAAEAIEARLGEGEASKLHGVRYLSVGEGPRLYDRWLRRTCTEEFSLGPSRRNQVLSFARVVHPNVQQVFDLGDERALFEASSSVLLSQLTHEQSATRVAGLLSQLDEALDALFEANVAHGAVDEEHVAVEERRVLLLIPNSPMPSATREADRAALTKLRRRMFSG